MYFKDFKKLRIALACFHLLNYFIRFVHLPALRITTLIVKLLLIDLVAFLRMSLAAAPSLALLLCQAAFAHWA